MSLPISRRTFLETIAQVSMSAGLVACSRQRSNAIVLAFVPKALSNPVFEITRHGAEDRIAELGGGIEFRWIGPATADAAAQAQIIDDLVVQRVSGICLSCNDPNALLPAIDRAVDAGIPVITWDADSPKSKRLTNVSIDQAAAGARAAELLVQRAPKGKLAILTGSPSALNLQQRLEGFMSVIRRYPDITVIASDPCNDDVQRAVEIVEQRINATPDLVSYFFVGMWPFFADLRTMPNLKKLVDGGGTIVSLDALEGALNAVEQGYATALVGYSWWGFGRTAVDVLLDRIKRNVRPPALAAADLFVVDKTNIAEYLRKQKETQGRF